MSEIEDVERKPYEANSSPEELRRLRALVTEPRPNLIRYTEPPIVTKFQQDVFFERIHQLIRDKERYYFLIDLRYVERPSRDVLDYLQVKFRTVSPSYVAVCTGRGMVMNVIAGMVLSRAMGRYRYSIHSTEEDAMVRLRTVMAEKPASAQP